MNPASDDASAPVIQMTDLTVVATQEPERVVVEGVHWSVAPGDSWALAGLHGSGKSDFLRVTAGLAAPLRGQYRLFAKAMPIVTDDQLPTRLRLGLVFDSGQLLNHLTIAENVALPLRYHQNLSAAAAADRVEAMLDATQLTPWADHMPSTVGRNWQRRAGLARALMLHPEVLLLDEPLAGLDLRHTQWWLGFLDQLSAGHPVCGGQPTTRVVTTGNLRVWKGHARQFALLKDQRFVPLGGWDAVERSTEPIVREMLATGGPIAPAAESGSEPHPTTE